MQIIKSWRRNLNERDELRKFASELLLLRILTAIDTLRGQRITKDAGLDLAFREFIAILEGEGVEEIKTVGELFDPHQMECIDVVEGEDNKVVEELRQGYRLHGKVLRVAHVKVGKKKI